MALSDHSPHYYVHMNVTDPSFFDNGGEDGDEICPLCGEPVRDGDRLYSLWHPEMGRGQIVFHEECLHKGCGPEICEAVFGILESLGIEIGVPS